MADLEWIKRTVNTLSRKCPLLGRTCIGNACAWWLSEDVRQGSETHTVRVGGCAVMFDYAMHHEVVLETVRVRADIDKAVNVTVDTPRRLVNAMVGARAMLRGNGGG